MDPNGAPNEKENKAGERNGKFPVPLYPMAIDGLLP